LNASQIKDIKQIFAKIDKEIHLVCVCGNHDVGDQPTSYTINSYVSNFGDDYFTFWVGGCKFLVLNSQFYKNDSQCKDLSEKQSIWLEEEIEKTKKEKPQHFVIFSHIPPFLLEEDEHNEYFNIEKSCRKKLLDQIKSAKASHWFCGHYHENKLTKTKDGLEIIITAAVGTNIIRNPNEDVLGLKAIEGMVLTNNYSGYRLVKVTKSNITHEFLNLKESPKF